MPGTAGGTPPLPETRRWLRRAFRSWQKIVSFFVRLRFPHAGQVDRELLLAIHAEQFIHARLMIGKHRAGSDAARLRREIEILANMPRFHGDHAMREICVLPLGPIWHRGPNEDDGGVSDRRRA